MQKNGKMIPCKWCGKPLYTPLWRQRYKHRFCNQSCAGKYKFSDKAFQKKIKRHTGKNHWSWKKEGCLRKDGYVLISVNGQRYFKHRYVMEKHLKRKLSFNETVHHIDGNRSNNKLNNLELLSRSEHTIKYHKKQKRDHIKSTRQSLEF